MSKPKMIVRFRHCQPMHDGWDYDLFEIDYREARRRVTPEKALATFVAIRNGFSESDFPPGFFELTIQSDFGTGIEDGEHGAMAKAIALIYGACKPVFWQHNPTTVKAMYAWLTASLLGDRLEYAAFDFAESKVGISNDRSTLIQLPAKKAIG